MTLDFSNTKIDKDSIDTIIYHGGGCLDGFCSAFIAWYYFKSKGKDVSKLEFIPAHYDFSDLETVSKNIPNVSKRILCF